MAKKILNSKDQGISSGKKVLNSKNQGSSSGKKVLNSKNQGSSSGKKVLIIEDDRFLRELISRKLLDEGFVTVEAIDGEEGIKKTKEEKPDLILLDLILPSIDGFEVLSQIKKDESVKSIPVVILSNLGQKEEVEKGLKLGAVDYLIKAHFTPGEIIEKIKSNLK